MKNRILSLLLVICTLCSFMSFTALPVFADAYTLDMEDFTITVSNGEATIERVHENFAGKYTVPSSIEGYRVTAIGEEAFFMCTQFTEIAIPNSVTSIGAYAFRGCSSLQTITIPSSITSIAPYTFSDCGIKRITIPSSVTTIGDYAFKNCINLTSITIPSSVTTIGYSVFYYCHELASISVASNNDYYCSVGGVLFSKNKKALICYPAGKTATSYSIPNTVAHISNDAFYYCIDLKSITIPDSVTYIGDGAFGACWGLKNIDIPSSVISIGEEVFKRCDALTDITVSSNNKFFCSVNGILFSKDWKKLICYPSAKLEKSYSVPMGVTNICDGAFVRCNNLTRITLPNSVTKIGNNAFQICSSLSGINIPNSVTSIGDRAFSDCRNLTSMAIPRSVTIISDYTFSRCSNLATVTLPNSVTKIGNNAFENCRIKNVHYAGTRSSWAKISIGSNNSYLTDAFIHYNSDGPKGFVLSETNILATAYTSPTINVYESDGVTPYNRSVEVESSNRSIVLPVTNGNVIALNCKATSSDTITITIKATDGSGIKQVCNVKVTEKIESDDDDLLERFALSRLVYYNLTVDKKVGDSAIKANKSAPMFYLTLDKKVTWGEFYKQYINDYKVVMLPQKPLRDGFYAAAFESPEGEIIIAYRGTQPETSEDLLTDAAMVFGFLNKQFEQALEFYDDVKKENPSKNISLTGHSLGGALASYVAINRKVQCDNVNGATDWLFRGDVIASNNKYYVDYDGYDKYIFENINDSFLTGNSLITKFVNMDQINHSLYADTQNYNKKNQKIALVDGEDKIVAEILTRDYHDIASIINYSNENFSLTQKTSESSLCRGIEQLDSFIGTSKNDTFIGKPRPGRVPGRNQSVVNPTDNYVLAGEGDDVITIPEGGNDILIGNTGNDSLNGGAGNDIYVYGGNFGNDTIFDPSGKDKIVFTNLAISDIVISGNAIFCGSDSITISDKLKRKTAFIIEDKNKNTTTIQFEKTRMFSLREVNVNTTKGIQVFGNATIEIYDAYEELLDTITINEETQTVVEYKDYGMVAFSVQEIGLTLPPEGYIIKVKSDESVSVWAVSDADNPTVARQTFVNDKDLSAGSMIVINTGEMIEEQLSVKFVNGIDEEVIHTSTPESFVITADKTEIKTGESVTISVPVFYAASAQWESSNGNVAITKNEDFSVNVTGFTVGEDTIRAYLPNDELYSAEISIEITEDSAPNVAIISNDKSYDGTIAATDSVLFDVAVPEGYDTVMFDTQSSYSQVEDTNTFVVNEVGEHAINIYCKNSQTGAITKAFVFEFSQDSEAPTIAGVTNEAVYYTDRIVDIADDSLDAVCLNGELCDETSFIISEVGNYTITAVDTFGNTADASFEIKEMPAAEDIKQADSEMVSKIRNDFEAVKYLLPEERMNTLEASIHQLEEVLYTVTEVTSFTAETTASNAQITLRIANAPVDSTIYVASYNSLGKMLEIQKLTLENGVGEEVFSTEDVYSYKAFVWNNNLMPFVNSTECYPR